MTGATGTATSAALLVTGGATSGSAFTATGNDTGIRALGGTRGARGLRDRAVVGAGRRGRSGVRERHPHRLHARGQRRLRSAGHRGQARAARRSGPLGSGIGLEVTSGGTLELLGTQAAPLVIENHPNNGLNVADGSVSAQWVSFRANKELRIEQTDGQPHTLSFQDCAFSAAESEPAVFRAVQSGPLTIERSTFTGGQVGLDRRACDGRAPPPPEPGDVEPRRPGCSSAAGARAPSSSPATSSPGTAGAVELDRRAAPHRRQRHRDLVGESDPRQLAAPGLGERRATG